MLLWPGTELMTPLSAAFFPTLDRTTAMPFSKYDVTQRKFAECRKLTRWRMRPTSLPAKTCREGPASAMVAPQAFVDGGQDRYRMRRRVSRLPGLTVGVVTDLV